MTTIKIAGERTGNKVNIAVEIIETMVTGQGETENAASSQTVTTRGMGGGTVAGREVTELATLSGEIDFASAIAFSSLIAVNIGEAGLGDGIAKTNNHRRVTIRKSGVGSSNTEPGAVL